MGKRKKKVYLSPDNETELIRQVKEGIRTVKEAAEHYNVSYAKAHRLCKGMSKKGGRRLFTADEKAEIIRQVRSGMRTVDEAADHFSLHHTTIHRWIREVEVGKEVVDHLHINKNKRKTDPIRNLTNQNATMRQFLLDHFSKDDLLDMVLKSMDNAQ